MSFANIKASLPLMMWPIPKPQWHPHQLPDHTGKVVLITGGNTGIGFETAKALLEKNAKVYIGCRSKARADEAISKLKETHPHNPAQFLELDLADLGSIERAAKEFKEKESKLNVLYNNAGVMVTPLSMLTKDGYDLQFGTNVLGHWYFTQLVTPSLLAASTPTERSRVIFVSSAAAYGVTGIDYDTLRETPQRSKTSRVTLYNQSKLGDVMLASEYARQYADKIDAFSVHPGMIVSELQRYLPSYLSWFTTYFWDKFIGHPASLGAYTQLYAGGSEEAAQHNGKYFVPWARLGTMPQNGDNPEACAKLWRWCEEQVAGRQQP